VKKQLVLMIVFIVEVVTVKTSKCFCVNRSYASWCTFIHSYFLVP